jgi:WhiB family redox-sensing transcriptional regulator
MTRHRLTSQHSARSAGSPVVIHDMLALATPGLGSDSESVTAWMAEGSCRLYPPNKFFPSDGAGVERARKICATCPVSQQCLDYALEHRIEHGVWGGCSERERRRILKRRRIEVSSD